MNNFLIPKHKLYQKSRIRTRQQQSSYLIRFISHREVPFSLSLSHWTSLMHSNFFWTNRWENFWFGIRINEPKGSFNHWTIQINSIVCKTAAPPAKRPKYGPVVSGVGSLSACRPHCREFYGPTLAQQQCHKKCFTSSFVFAPPRFQKQQTNYCHLSPNTPNFITVLVNFDSAVNIKEICIPWSCTTRTRLPPLDNFWSVAWKSKI